MLYDAFRVHIIPVDRRVGWRNARRPGGVINCYSRVLDPSDSSVLRSSVLVARGDLFFKLPHSARGSPFLPLLPDQPPLDGAWLLFALLFSSLLSSLSNSACLSIPLPSLLPTKCLRFDASMISFETPFRRSSLVTFRQAATTLSDPDRSSNSAIAVNASLFYQRARGRDPLPPSPDSDFPGELARAFRGGGAFGCRTCDRTRRFRHDASLALRPIRGFSRDAAFPR